MINPNDNTEWRLSADKPEGWEKNVTPHDPNKYFIVSSDTHLVHPKTLFLDKLDKKWQHLLPRFEVRDGKTYVLMDGYEPHRIFTPEFEGDDLARHLAGGTAGIHGEEHVLGWDRIREQEDDGVDAEVMFSNALNIWSSRDNEFVQAQIEVWNDWAWETCKEVEHRSRPVAHIIGADVDMAVKEVERVAKMGYKIVTLPCKPIFGPDNVADINYNLPVFDPLWAAIQDADLTLTYHIATGRDPRVARGNGGAVVNFVCHSLIPTIEPIVNMCASGVFEKFPNLRVAGIEVDGGWAPWVLAKMDEAYLKHHFWVRPKLKELPSQYFKNNCFVTFGEDTVAMDLIEKYGLENNMMWANDYPHHEGSWPYSEQSIYRTIGDRVSEETRAKVLGLNAAKCFRFDIPEKYR